MNVLFVCTGNICRSPMAEAIAKEMAGDLDMAFGSAGLYAMDGACASPNAVEAAMAFGADVSDHRARQLDPEVAGWADRIYVMTEEHLAGISASLPTAAGKTVLLDPAAEVADPYGSDLATYLMSAGQIAGAIEALAAGWRAGPEA